MQFAKYENIKNGKISLFYQTEWYLGNKDIAEQFEKRDISLDNMNNENQSLNMYFGNSRSILVQCKKDIYQILFWPPRSRASEHNVLFFLDCWISRDDQKALNLSINWIINSLFLGLIYHIFYWYKHGKYDWWDLFSALSLKFRLLI